MIDQLIDLLTKSLSSPKTQDIRVKISVHAPTILNGRIGNKSYSWTQNHKTYPNELTLLSLPVTLH